VAKVPNMKLRMSAVSASVRMCTLAGARVLSRVPSVSELSRGGLIKHAAMAEQAGVTFVVEGDSSILWSEDPTEWRDGFRLVDGETLADVASFSDEVAGHTEKIVADLPDLGASLPATTPGAPGIPTGLVWTPRWILLHLIEETARHAGHADIIRESLDGATCWTLMAPAEGWPEQGWE
jgi:hypothetical protein